MAATEGTLENKRLRDTWQQLLRVDDADGIDSTLEKVVDGNAGECPLYVSDTKIQIKPTTDASDVFKVSQADGDAVLTINTTLSSVSEGSGSATSDAGWGDGIGAHAEGVNTLASGGLGSHAEGSGTIASGYGSHAGGMDSTASGRYAPFAHGKDCIADGKYSFALGQSCETSGTWAFAMGAGCTATEMGAIALMHNANASGIFSVSIGQNSEATDMYAVSIGPSSHATARSAFSRGFMTRANGEYSDSSGYYCAANGDNSRAGGVLSIADAKLSRADGHRSRATDYGQRAFSSMDQNVYGAAQESRYMLWGQTTDATLTEIFLDGSSGRMTIASDSTWLFHARIVARQTNVDGNSAGYELKGVIDNNAGTTALASALTKVEVGEDVGAWDVTAVADDTNDALVVKVTGAVGDNVTWVAFVNTVEVIG